MKIYRTDFDVDTKSDASPVTLADQHAEDLILKAIRAEVSDAYPIVAEESVAAGTIPEVGDGPFWLVDPLDGTKQFVTKKGEFTVNIALIENRVPVLGVVHAPALNATYWGSVHGAFAETDGAKPRRIGVRSPAADGIVAVVSRSHRTPEVDEFLKDYTVKEEISSGSSIKFCLVATGRADVYPRMGRTMEWDTAAGHAVLRAAGGRMTTADGGKFLYAKPGFENPHFIAWGADGK
ncbi:MAG: 3'(2'),5'-bisphosphate nucleotidase CysQ [Hyphomicrobiales bacterium]|nr:3'(2'),5'-bisphosphate nucleotidase CysQ [Hyphomicrobiales bacterium]MCP5372536.1 3'(2'),5'-bisphosphate nucleotidase CysQ [Hyphomicrobiales bacterium]